MDNCTLWPLLLQQLSFLKLCVNVSDDHAIAPVPVQVPVLVAEHLGIQFHVKLSFSVSYLVLCTMCVHCSIVEMSHTVGSCNDSANNISK